MPQLVLIDEIHLRLHILQRASDRDVQRIRRTLKHPRFLTALRRSLRHLLTRYASLQGVRIEVSR